MKVLKEQLKSSINEDSKETLIYEYAQQNVNNIYELIVELPEMWKTLTTPKHSKIIKNILEKHNLSENILNKIILWAEEKNKKNLKLELILYLTNSQFNKQNYIEVLENIEKLIFEYKMLDERRKLADIYLLKSQTLYQMGSFQKARSVLSAARGISLSTICSNRSVAKIDLLSGVFLCDDGDYSGAGSYFLEAVSGFKKDFKLLELTFDYIILSKIMNHDFIGIQRILNSRDFMNFNQNDNQKFSDMKNNQIEILLKIAEAVKEADLQKFEVLFLNDKINFDVFIKTHLSILYQKLFNEALKKMIFPYESVYISFICEKLNIKEETALEKLHEIISKKEIDGMIDFKNGVLRITKKNRNLCDFGKLTRLINEK